MLNHGLSLTLTITQDLVNACLLVPAGYGEEVLLVGGIGVEGKVADAVLGGLAELDILLKIAEGVARGCSGGTEKTSHVWLVLGVARLELGSLELSRVSYVVVVIKSRSSVTTGLKLCNGAKQLLMYRLLR